MFMSVLKNIYATMETRKSINFADLPRDTFEAREFIVARTGEWSLSESAKFINEKYVNRELLEHAVDFFSYDLIDAAPSDGDSLIKLGLFPWVEASSEIEKALSLIMLSFYKNSYDSM